MGVCNCLRALFSLSCFRVLSCMNCLYACGAVMHAASGTEAEEAFTHQRTSLRNWISADVGSLTGLLFAAWTITQSKI